MKLSQEKIIQLNGYLNDIGLAGWDSAESCNDENSFAICFRYHDVSFADLSLISESFGTKEINIGTKERDDGHCETCSSPYSVNLVFVKNPTKGVKL